MTVYFNDITLTSCARQDMLLLKDLREVWDEFMRQTDGSIGIMRSLPFNESERLSALASEVGQSSSKDIREFFYHKIVPVYRQELESIGDSYLVEKYDSSEYTVEDLPGGKTQCKIMGWAMLNRGITLGLASSRFWNQPCPRVRFVVEEYDQDKDDIIRTDAAVDCITRKDHLNKVDCITRKDHSNKIDYRQPCVDEIEDDVCDPPDVVFRRKNGKIIVLGANNVMELKQLAADIGFDITRFSFIPYERLQNYDCRKWKDSEDIVAIMCGPVPHSGAGMGDSGSLYNTIRTEPGYPPVEPLQSSIGKLKVTINSFRLGLLSLMKKRIIDKNFD